MKAGGLMVAAVTLAFSVPTASRSASCGQVLETVTVCQRCYHQLTSPPFAGGRVFVYSPDIKSSVLGAYEPFKIWIVEGLYGKPFINSSGTLNDSAWDQIRNSRNVRATPADVAEKSGKTSQFRISKAAFVLEIVKVNTSWSGSDSVTIRVCR